ncbi:MAG TPA: hypothetical protein VGH74_14475 [Planctomycetaceae bacterium]|jgi:hypothetical protein
MSIFPLPLVPFEHYMLADDGVDYPMTFFMRMQFRGLFDRARAEAALAAALRWHPLLGANVRGCIRDQTSRLVWERRESSTVPIVWESAAAQIDFASGLRIDLFHQTGLRAWFREADNSTELLCQFHHACCDGLGAIQFLETFLEIYAAVEEPQPPPEWEARHAERHVVACGGDGRNWKDHLVQIGQGLKRIGRYFKTRPMPLAVPAGRSVVEATCAVEVPPMVSHFFDEAGTDQIRAGAKQLNVAANSLLMSELFLALDDWNRSRSREGASRPLRVVVPVNLRSTARERLPAFNAVSLAFIDRQPADLATGEGLLEGIDREVGEAKALRCKMALLPVLRFLGHFHNGICGRLKKCSCLGSTVFSNLGIVFFGSRVLGHDRLVRCGDLVLERFEAAPPVRRNTLAGFAVSMYGNALTISMCYDPHKLTPHDARALLDLYVRRLQVLSLDQPIPQSASLAE